MYTATNSILSWPTQITERLNPEDKMILERQLKALPDGLGQRLLDDLADRMKKITVRNPTTHLLANLKRAREGRFNLDNSATDKPLEKIQPQPPKTVLVVKKKE